MPPTYSIGKFRNGGNKENIMGMGVLESWFIGMCLYFSRKSLQHWLKKAGDAAEVGNIEGMVDAGEKVAKLKVKIAEKEKKLAASL
jgi:hypothetical protein